MFQALQVLTVMLAAVAMALALAHALELPGKLRLPKDAYLATQTIYYPGFTIGGIAEIVGLIATLALTVLTLRGSAAFWLTLAAFVALLAMHAVYWLVTHPVNNFWVKDFKLTGAGARFFSFAAAKPGADGQMADWTVLRDRWEYSHVVRAILALLGFGLLVAAVASGPVSR
jgi:hypothetical protein